MIEKIRKPAGWETSTCDELLTCEAGQAFIAAQLNGVVPADCVFVSTRKNCDRSVYRLYSDGSLWFVNNAQDEVWTDAADFIARMEFEGLYWDEADADTGANLVVDGMDRELLVHVLGADEAERFFVAQGGAESGRYAGIEHDRSGVGHCWEHADQENCPADVLLEIECEQIQGGVYDCDKYVASNGEIYRWR